VQDNGIRIPAKEIGGPRIKLLGAQRDEKLVAARPDVDLACVASWNTH
jgi:hypothetical protein